MTINEVKIIPNKIPFKCPVCNGFGSLQYGKKVCHACNGKGYVVVDNDEREIDEKKYGVD